MDLTQQINEPPLKDKPANILIVDDDSSIRSTFTRALEQDSYFCRTASDGEEALRSLSEGEFDLVLTDLEMPKMDGLTLLASIAERNHQVMTIVITAHGEIDLAVEATRLGAYDFLSKPVNEKRLRLSVARALEYHRLVLLNQKLMRRKTVTPTFGKIIGEHTSMLEIFQIIAQIAPTNANVLITGESGTGKEMVARAVHDYGKRSDKIFNIVDCTAIPEGLLESVLFGHKRGSFTGADKDHTGLVGYSDGGTIFFDEIAELPLHLQAKLLRLIQERSFLPVGGEREVKVDIRIVAATNRDLEQEVRAGRFREDLYYRLNVVPIHLPLLRERGQDVATLAFHFLNEFAGQHPYVTGITQEALNCIQAYSWPGNIRELRNAIEGAVSLTAEEVVRVQDLPEPVRSASVTHAKSSRTYDLIVRENWATFKSNMERDYLTKLMISAEGNISQAAEHAEISRKKIYKMLNDAGLDPQDFRNSH